MPTTRVLLVDDRPIFRQGVRTILENEPDFVVVGEVSSLGDMMRAIPTLGPDVVLLEIQLFHPPGAAPRGRLPVILTATRVVVLTTNASPDLFLRAIYSGVQGYLLKDAGPGQVVQAVRAAAQGGAVLDPRLTPHLLRTFQARALQEPPSPPPAGATAELTRREQVILRLVAAGYTNKEIGLHLSLAEKTIRNNLHHLFARLHLTSRAEAAAFAVQQRLTLSALDPGDLSAPGTSGHSAPPFLKTAAGHGTSREVVPPAGPRSFDPVDSGQLEVN